MRVAGISVDGEMLDVVRVLFMDSVVSDSSDASLWLVDGEVPFIGVVVELKSDEVMSSTLAVVVSMSSEITNMQ